MECIDTQQAMISISLFPEKEGQSVMVKLNSLLPEIATFVKKGQNIVSSILAMRIWLC